MRPAARALVLASLLLSPVPLLAHGERPVAAHGGEVQDAQGIWIELAVKGSDVGVLLVGEDHRPIPAQSVSGSATVLVGGKSYKVELSPGAGNGLEGKLPVPVTGKLVAAVSLKVDGKPVSARFASPA